MPFGSPPFPQFGRLKSTGGAWLHRWASAAAGWWKSQGKWVFQGAELEACSWLWSWWWFWGVVFLEGYSDPTKKARTSMQVSTIEALGSFIPLEFLKKLWVVENRMEIHSTLATPWYPGIKVAGDSMHFPILNEERLLEPPRIHKITGSPRWWFQIFVIFTPTWGNDLIWLIFFKWVETTN